jgi:23S rRNA pseudouridine2605 synthase
MRLNAFLARGGVASRRGADELIKAGRVTVNGAPGELNTFVESRDRVEVDGQPVEKQALSYLLLHKPAGVVTTARDPRGRRTVVDLVGGHGTRVVPVGRLDADTTGALLLTNDGDELDDGPTAPGRVRRLGPGRVELSIHEGRKHQVKRMLAAVGHPVTRLHRSRYAGLALEGLEPGAWRELEPSEIDRLRKTTTPRARRTRQSPPGPRQSTP